MNDKMLTYALKQTDIAVRMMFRDKSTIHVYDLGSSSATGEEFCMVLQIVPKKLVEEKMVAALGPLTDTAPLLKEGAN